MEAYVIVFLVLVGILFWMLFLIQLDKMKRIRCCGIVCSVQVSDKLFWCCPFAYLYRYLLTGEYDPFTVYETPEEKEKRVRNALIEQGFDPVEIDQRGALEMGGYKLHPLLAEKMKIQLREGVKYDAQGNPISALGLQTGPEGSFESKTGPEGYINIQPRINTSPFGIKSWRAMQALPNSTNEAIQRAENEVYLNLFGEGGPPATWEETQGELDAKRRLVATGSVLSADEEKTRKKADEARWEKQNVLAKKYLKNMDAPGFSTHKTYCTLILLKGMERSNLDEQWVIGQLIYGPALWHFRNPWEEEKDIERREIWKKLQWDMFNEQQQASNNSGGKKTNAFGQLDAMKKKMKSYAGKITDAISKLGSVAKSKTDGDSGSDTSKGSKGSRGSEGSEDSKASQESKASEASKMSKTKEVGAQKLRQLPGAAAALDGIDALKDGVSETVTNMKDGVTDGVKDLNKYVKGLPKALPGQNVKSIATVMHKALAAHTLTGGSLSPRQPVDEDVVFEMKIPKANFFQPPLDIHRLMPDWGLIRPRWSEMLAAEDATMEPGDWLDCQWRIQDTAKDLFKKQQRGLTLKDLEEEIKDFEIYLGAGRKDRSEGVYPLIYAPKPLIPLTDIVQLEQEGVEVTQPNNNDGIGPIIGNGGGSSGPTVRELQKMFRNNQLSNNNQVSTRRKAMKSSINPNGDDRVQLSHKNVVELHTNTINRGKTNFWTNLALPPQGFLCIEVIIKRIEYSEEIINENWKLKKKGQKQEEKPDKNPSLIADHTQKSTFREDGTMKSEKELKFDELTPDDLPPFVIGFCAKPYDKLSPEQTNFMSDERVAMQINHHFKDELPGHRPFSFGWSSDGMVYIQDHFGDATKRYMSLKNGTIEEGDVCTFLLDRIKGYISLFKNGQLLSQENTLSEFKADFDVDGGHHDVVKNSSGDDRMNAAGLGISSREGAAGLGISSREGAAGLGISSREGAAGLGISSREGAAGLGMPLQGGDNNAENNVVKTVGAKSYDKLKLKKNLTRKGSDEFSDIEYEKEIDKVLGEENKNANPNRKTLMPGFRKILMASRKTLFGGGESSALGGGTRKSILNRFGAERTSQAARPSVIARQQDKIMQDTLIGRFIRAKLKGFAEVNELEKMKPTEKHADPATLEEYQQIEEEIKLAREEAEQEVEDQKEAIMNFAHQKHDRLHTENKLDEVRDSGVRKGRNRYGTRISNLVSDLDLDRNGSGLDSGTAVAEGEHNKEFDLNDIGAHTKESYLLDASRYGNNPGYYNNEVSSISHRGVDDVNDIQDIQIISHERDAIQVVVDGRDTKDRRKVNRMKTVREGKHFTVESDEVFIQDQTHTKFDEEQIQIVIDTKPKKTAPKACSERFLSLAEKESSLSPEADFEQFDLAPDLCFSSIEHPQYIDSSESMIEQYSGSLDLLQRLADQYKKKDGNTFLVHDRPTTVVTNVGAAIIRNFRTKKLINQSRQVEMESCVACDDSDVKTYSHAHLPNPQVSAIEGGAYASELDDRSYAEAEVKRDNDNSSRHTIKNPVPLLPIEGRHADFPDETEGEPAVEGGGIDFPEQQEDTHADLPDEKKDTAGDHRSYYPLQGLSTTEYRRNFQQLNSIERSAFQHILQSEDLDRTVHPDVDCIVSHRRDSRLLVGVIEDAIIEQQDEAAIHQQKVAAYEKNKAAFRNQVLRGILSNGAWSLEGGRRQPLQTIAHKVADEAHEKLIAQLREKIPGRKFRGEDWIGAHGKVYEGEGLPDDYVHSEEEESFRHGDGGDQESHDDEDSGITVLFPHKLGSIREETEGGSRSNSRSTSKSPANRDRSPFNHDRSPSNRDESPSNRTSSPCTRRGSSPANRREVLQASRRESLKGSEDSSTKTHALAKTGKDPFRSMTNSPKIRKNCGYAEDFPTVESEHDSHYDSVDETDGVHNAERSSSEEFPQESLEIRSKENGRLNSSKGGGLDSSAHSANAAISNKEYMASIAASISGLSNSLTRKNNSEKKKKQMKFAEEEVREFQTQRANDADIDDDGSDRSVDSADEEGAMATAHENYTKSGGQLQSGVQSSTGLKSALKTSAENSKNKLQLSTSMSILRKSFDEGPFTASGMLTASSALNKKVKEATVKFTDNFGIVGTEKDDEEAVTNSVTRSNLAFLTVQKSENVGAVSFLANPKEWAKSKFGFGPPGPNIAVGDEVPGGEDAATRIIAGQQGQNQMASPTKSKGGVVGFIRKTMSMITNKFRGEIDPQGSSTGSTSPKGGMPYQKSDRPVNKMDKLERVMIGDRVPEKRKSRSDEVLRKYEELAMQKKLGVKGLDNDLQQIEDIRSGLKNLVGKNAVKYHLRVPTIKLFDDYQLSQYLVIGTEEIDLELEVNFGTKQYRLREEAEKLMRDSRVIEREIEQTVALSHDHFREDKPNLAKLEALKRNIQHEFEHGEQQVMIEKQFGPQTSKKPGRKPGKVTELGGGGSNGVGGTTDPNGTTRHAAPGGVKKPNDKFKTDVGKDKVGHKNAAAAVGAVPDRHAATRAARFRASTVLINVLKKPETIEIQRKKEEINMTASSIGSSLAEFNSKISKVNSMKVAPSKITRSDLSIHGKGRSLNGGPNGSLTGGPASEMKGLLKNISAEGYFTSEMELTRDYVAAHYSYCLPYLLYNIYARRKIDFIQLLKDTHRSTAVLGYLIPWTGMGFGHSINRTFLKERLKTVYGPEERIGIKIRGFCDQRHIKKIISHGQEEQATKELVNKPGAGIENPDSSESDIFEQYNARNKAFQKMRKQNCNFIVRSAVKKLKEEGAIEDDGKKKDLKSLQEMRRKGQQALKNKKPEEELKHSPLMQKYDMMKRVYGATLDELSFTDYLERRSEDKNKTQQHYSRCRLRGCICLMYIPEQYQFEVFNAKTGEWEKRSGEWCEYCRHGAAYHRRWPGRRNVYGIIGKSHHHNWNDTWIIQDAHVGIGRFGLKVPPEDQVDLAEKYEKSKYEATVSRVEKMRALKERIKAETPTKAAEECSEADNARVDKANLLSHRFAAAAGATAALGAFKKMQRGSQGKGGKGGEKGVIGDREKLGPNGEKLDADGNPILSAADQLLANTQRELEHVKNLQGNNGPWNNWGYVKPNPFVVLNDKEKEKHRGQWRKCISEDGHRFYYNMQTGHVQPERPPTGSFGSVGEWQRRNRPSSVQRCDTCEGHRPHRFSREKREAAKQEEKAKNEITLIAKRGKLRKFGKAKGKAKAGSSNPDDLTPSANVGASQDLELGPSFPALAVPSPGVPGASPRGEHYEQVLQGDVDVGTASAGLQRGSFAPAVPKPSGAGAILGPVSLQGVAASDYIAASSQMKENVNVNSVSPTFTKVPCEAITATNAVSPTNSLDNNSLGVSGPRASGVPVPPSPIHGNITVQHADSNTSYDALQLQLSGTSYGTQTQLGGGHQVHHLHGLQRRGSQPSLHGGIDTNPGKRGSTESQDSLPLKAIISPRWMAEDNQVWAKLGMTSFAKFQSHKGNVKDDLDKEILSAAWSVSKKLSKQSTDVAQQPMSMVHGDAGTDQILHQAGNPVDGRMSSRGANLPEGRTMTGLEGTGQSIISQSITASIRPDREANPWETEDQSVEEARHGEKGIWQDTHATISASPV